MDQSRDVEAGGGDHGGVYNDSARLGRKRSYEPTDGTRVTAILSWKDLTLTVNHKRSILQGLSGCAEPGRLTAILGPSGSGKTSLLDTLAGRPAREATVTGEILVNGNKAKLSYGKAAYLAQDATLLGTLTVFETLYFSARFRFRDSMSKSETIQIVMVAIEDVGLLDSMNTVIGTWFRRGISGGEKRRVTIAIELLKSPTLFFLDEPTSGLDSAASFHVIKTLKGLAQDGNRTILCSIHQPSSEVFELFDDLCLLSDGQQVYYGPLPQAEQFFEGCGYPCPPLRSASDHYLHCINSDFDAVQITLDKQASGSRSGRSSVSSGFDMPPQRTAKEAIAKLTQAYRTSDQKRSLDTRLETLSQMETDKFKLLPFADGTQDGGFEDKGSHASFLKQTVYLTIRSAINMYRDIGYFRMRIVMYLALSIALGTVFMNVGKNFTSIQARAAFFMFSVAFLTFMAISGFPSFIEDMKVFHTERMNGHYRVGAFVLANTLSSMPYILAISFVSTAIMYPLVGDFHGGFVHILYFLLNLYGSLLVSESLMMTVTSMVPQYLLGIMLGSALQGMFILVDGFFRLANDLPDPVWKYPLHYVSYITYAFQGLMENEFIGKKKFGNLNPNNPPLTGHYILHDLFTIETSRSKWWNLGILYMMFIGYRIIFWTLLSARENFFPNVGSVINKSASNLRAKFPKFKLSSLVSRTSRDASSSQEILVPE